MKILIQAVDECQASVLEFFIRRAFENNFSLKPQVFVLEFEQKPALNKASQITAFDFIIWDWNEYSEERVQFLRELRTANPTAEIVTTSGLPMSSPQIRLAFEIGASAFFLKPSFEVDWISLISRLFDRPNTHVPDENVSETSSFCSIHSKTHTIFLNNIEAIQSDLRPRKTRNQYSPNENP